MTQRKIDWMNRDKQEDVEISSDSVGRGEHVIFQKVPPVLGSYLVDTKDDPRLYVKADSTYDCT